jgi:hypothetical protein
VDEEKIIELVKIEESSSEKELIKDDDIIVAEIKIDNSKIMNQ